MDVSPDHPFTPWSACGRWGCNGDRKDGHDVDDYITWFQWTDSMDTLYLQPSTSFESSHLPAHLPNSVMTLVYDESVLLQLNCAPVAAQVVASPTHLLIVDACSVCPPCRHGYLWSSNARILCHITTAAYLCCRSVQCCNGAMNLHVVEFEVEAFAEVLVVVQTTLMQHTRL